LKEIDSPKSPRLEPPQEAADILTAEEVAKHDKETDAWVIIKDGVYDVTSFLAQHPGGIDLLLMNAGRDCTSEFQDIHPAGAWARLESLRIGTLGQRRSAGKL
jgi:nitrate reductase (NAD(P)H)